VLQWTQAIFSLFKEIMMANTLALNASRVSENSGKVKDDSALPRQIYQILWEAGRATNEYESHKAWELVREVISRLWEQAALKAEITAEIIEEAIEVTLMRSPFLLTAKAFVIARDRRRRAPEITRQRDVESIDQYLSRADWKVRENSNMAYSLQGLNNYLSGEMSQNYWLYNIYPAAIREAHESGDFHIHDLSQLSVYCVGWDLADLLREGFCGVAGKLEACPPKHFRTALGQVVNFFYTLQGEAAGAQAFSNFDTLLAPFIRHDHLDQVRVEQALQEFIFNINVPTRVGFQTPFTNITLDLFCPRHLASEPVIMGGQLQSETYGEFQEEMNILNRSLFRVMTQGDARGRIMTFPIPTINLTKDFDWDNENLRGLWEMTGKYGIPYFSNFINSDMNPEDTRSMCCRLRIDNTQLEKRGGGLFGANPLTGSVGVVTINLPRIAYLSQSKGEFYSRLGQLMDLARESLEIKRRFLEQLTERNLYPYISFYLRQIKQRFGTYWQNHFSTIGLVGMNEACLNFLGAPITSEEGKAFALEVLDFMRERLVTYQRETGHHYNLEATPAEGTSYRLARKDKKRFGKIIEAANDREEGAESDAPFYTNSIHVPVNYTDDLFEVLDHQDELQTKFTGGTVVHLFLGERIQDPDVVKRLVKKVAEHYHLPYFSLTPTFSVCPDHGYLSGEHAVCPKCDKVTEIYSRVVGYLRPVQQWNDGKQSEFKLRKTLKFA
jgi:ribonucleoside-triphosphate reductase